MLLSNETSFIQGVHQTPIIGQQERTDDLNIRIRSRQFPDFPLEPQYDFRPVSTKYQLQGQNAQVKKITAKQSYMTHNVAMNFNPATRNGPWKTYVANIDTETVLRNYKMGERNAADSTYVPNSNSDLYRNGTTIVDRPVAQPYELLFAKPEFESTPTRWSDKIGIDRFNNSTRTQLKQGI